MAFESALSMGWKAQARPVPRQTHLPNRIGNSPHQSPLVGSPLKEAWREAATLSSYYAWLRLHVMIAIVKARELGRRRVGSA